MSEPSSRLLFSTKQLNINGGTFNEITGDYNQFHIQGDYHNSRVESGLNALSQVISHGAIHDSSERFPPAKCHPDTRKEVLRLIKEWIEDLEPTSPVFWLYGPAGAGKTAILQSIAELFCSSDGCWGASFFFSKGKLGRDQGHYLFTTIAYQLALNIPGLRDHINHVLAIDPTLHTKPMHIQLQRLIIDTFAQLKSQPQRTQVVVIDGLDECQGHEMQQGILSLISQALVSNKVPLRFLIASRPEAHIRESFDQDTLYTITRRVVLDESFNPSRDIKLFLQHGFADICARNSRLMSHVEKPWPREGIIDLLVQKSSGQFIYAATVLKFVGTEFFRPTKQLAIVLEPNSLQSTAFSDLDHLYTQILSVHPDPGSLVHLLGIIAALRYPQPPEVIEDIFNMEEGEVSLVLRGLHSLLSFPDDPEGHYKRKDHRRNHSGIRVLHASFYDYLVDETRSGPFHVDLMAAHSKLALAGFPFILRRIILPERWEEPSPEL
ncbi:hypothetical protein B0H34DRAFT_292711 [Crassisporium funariophilum]|nr:hypothetical protein B0H34DRAFT_292711 [Crassisporium funariophilum]